VKTTCTPGSPPAAQGGTIPDGIYTLQSRSAYGSSCPSEPDRQGTLVICGNELDWALTYDPLTSPAYYMYQYAITHPQPNALVLTPQCTTDLDTTVDQLSYTFAAGQLTLISDVTSVYVKK
jgi:hypothetical protein